MRYKIASSVAKGERRALERKARGRVLCSSCNRPPTQCLCDVLPNQKIKTETDVLVLQHPAEFRRKTFSTVPLLSLVLQNVQVAVGHSFDPDILPPLRDAQLKGKKLLLLFPDEDAIDLDESVTSNTLDGVDIVGLNLNHRTQPDSPGNLLILIDGTWTQAARMARNSPKLLNCCQKVHFTSSQRSIYDAIRKEPKEHCLSTVEACSQAMQLLEPNSKHVKKATFFLESALAKLVERQLQYARHSRPRYVSRDKADDKIRQRQEAEHEVFGTVAQSDVEREHQASPPNAAQQPRVMTLPDGATLRPLSTIDTDWVDSKWPYRSKTSRTMVLRQLSDPNVACCCLGIEDQESLRACIMRYANGALGMLHVDPEYRRLGYASALLREATRVLEARGERCEAFIRDGNEASEALFRKLEWKAENSNCKRGTGNRRSKRRWYK